MQRQLIFFQDKGVQYFADTCEPLKAAAASGEIEMVAWSRASYPGKRLPGDDLKDLRSIGVWHAERPQSWGLDSHCNEGVELSYIFRGSVGFEVDGRKWTLRKGNFAVTRPWQFHSVGNPNVDPCRMMWVILDVKVRRPNQEWVWPEWLVFSRKDMQRLTQLLSHNEQPVWNSDAATARSFEKLDEVLAAPSLDVSKLKIRINELLLAIRDCLETGPIKLEADLAGSRRAVEIFLERLPQHIEMPWTLHAMAEECGLSRSTFSSYCRDLVNATPIAYLTRIRLEKAADLLFGPKKLPVTDIALACGFSSSQYFATLFKNHFGDCPTTYRESRPDRAASVEHKAMRVFQERAAKRLTQSLPPKIGPVAHAQPSSYA